MKSAALAALVILTLPACREVAELRERARGASPHEEYAAALADANLLDTALGRAWTASAERALLRPAAVRLPHREAVFLPPEEAGAAGFAFPLLEGEALTVTVERGERWSGRAFVDLFEIPADSGAAPRRLTSADSLAAEIAWVARRDGRYLLRLQPELLGGGRVTVVIRTGPSLAFPVEGRTDGAVGSTFGDPRDGGSRDHHGIDIFAPRGTPVVAAAEGVVRSVDTTRIGGRVVWLLDRRQGVSLYYAHLDSQTVARGATVRPGDTLGTVGTTGNARGTPPHLHFGIYRRGRGPVDPLPFVRAARAAPPAVQVDTGSLGEWRRTASAARLRPGPGSDDADDGGAEIAAGTPVLALGGSRGWYRVRLPDGAEGYLPARATEPATPDGTLTLPAGALLLHRPRTDAIAIDTISPGETLPSLGRFGDFTFVRAGSGRAGWVREEF